MPSEPNSLWIISMRNKIEVVIIGIAIWWSIRIGGSISNPKVQVNFPEQNTQTDLFLIDTIAVYLHPAISAVPGKSTTPLNGT